MTTLTVALPLVRPTVGTDFSYALSDGNQTVLGHGFAPLARLPVADAVVLVVPARALSWHQVKLPALAASRMKAALEGALEERLLDEPSSLAFAVGPERGSDGTVTVAACDKAWLAGTLEFFEHARRPATRVVPEWAPVARGAQPQACVAVTGTAQDPWITVVDTAAVVCAPLGAAPVLLASAAHDADTAPLLAEPAVAAVAEHLLARPPLIRQVAEGLVASSQSPWELAQFELAISSSGRMARRAMQVMQQLVQSRAWRPARWALVVMLLANLIGVNAWAWRQDAVVKAKREQVKGVLSQTFPKVKTIVDPPLQMERELALLRQASGALSARDLEAMLGAVGAALPPGKFPSAIDFGPGEAAVRGLGLDAAQVAEIGRKLGGVGYTVRLDGDRLVVRSGGRP